MGPWAAACAEHELIACAVPRLRQADGATCPAYLRTWSGTKSTEHELMAYAVPRLRQADGGATCPACLPACGLGLAQDSLSTTCSQVAAPDRLQRSSVCSDRRNLRLSRSPAAGYTGYQYMQGLPFMRKANAKRAKQSKQRRAAQPVREANPEEWLKGTNFAQVRLCPSSGCCPVAA